MISLNLKRRVKKRPSGLRVPNHQETGWCKLVISGLNSLGEHNVDIPHQ
jgi:hypothetical protein